MFGHGNARPRLLDLFSGAGGCARGYQMAGFTVVGVDIAPQPRYAGDEFIQADALEYVAKHGHEFDVIHASPPCQRYSEATPVQYRDSHPDLIEPVRELLAATGKPYVIENVSGARGLLINPVMLCGTMFGLLLWRHRFFETWPVWLMSPATCRHNFAPVTIHTGSNTRRLGRPSLVADMRRAMQIDWMGKEELHEAIPPAYTEWIGRHLLEAVTA